MRGRQTLWGGIFSDVSLESRIAEDHPLRALLLQVLYTIRSDRQLVEQLEYNLLYRWFVGAGSG